MKIEQFSRIINHTITSEGVVFTNPTSNDHTDKTWSETDLYIGEIGINVTDDSAFFRTNNGIVQFVTGTASGTTASTDSLWSFVGDEVVISSTYSATAITRNVSEYTDLGNSTLRFKDLYLGGSADGDTTINTNGLFTIRDNTNEYITNVSGGSDTSLLAMGSTCSTADKTLPLHLVSKNCVIEEGTSLSRIIIASKNSDIADGANYTTIISGATVSVGADAENSVYIGDGKGRDFDGVDTLCVGGTLQIRGVEDDGSGAYDNSDLIKSQSKLLTSTALTTPIFQYTFANPGAIQFRAMILGIDSADASLCYSAEIRALSYYDGTDTEIADNAFVDEINVLDTDVGVSVDATGGIFSLSVTGTAANTIQWLCSYEYHVLQNQII